VVAAAMAALVWAVPVTGRVLLRGRGRRPLATACDRYSTISEMSLAEE